VWARAVSNRRRPEGRTEIPYRPYFSLIGSQVSHRLRSAGRKQKRVQQLKQQIKGLEAIIQQASPLLPSEKSKPVAENERVDKDDLPLDAQGW
jgi:hypothetical protein